MPYRHILDPDRRMIWTTYADGASPEAIEAAHAQLVADPRFDPSFSHLFDASRATDAAVFSTEIIQRLARLKLLNPDSRRAVIIPDHPLALGLFRMYQLYRELRGPIRMQVFTRREEALASLGLPPEARPPEPA